MKKIIALAIFLLSVIAITSGIVLMTKQNPPDKPEIINLEEATKKFVEKEIVLNENKETAPKKIEQSNQSSQVISTSSAETKKPTDFNLVQTTSSEPIKASEPTENKNNFTVKLVINDQEFVTLLEKNSTAYTAMQKIAAENPSFTFTGKLYNSLGFFVDSINNLKNDYQKGEYWILYINGAKSKVGVSNYTINQGDIISWKYEKSI